MVAPAPEPGRHPVRDAAKALHKRIGTTPRVAMLLGSGHAAIAARLEDRKVIHHDELPTGVEFTEQAPLLSGTLEGVQVVVSDPPVAAYEGRSHRHVTFPIRVLRALGAEYLLLTAGGASLDRRIEPGAVVVIEDHLNLSGSSPLGDPDDEGFGPRFPDMSAPYSERLRRLVGQSASAAGLSCPPAIYAGVPGPSLPTRAEYRFYRQAGADVVGTTVVPEVLVAIHAGFEVLALAGVTQVIHPEQHTPTTIEDMLDAADVAAPRAATLLAGIVRALA